MRHPDVYTNVEFDECYFCGEGDILVSWSPVSNVVIWKGGRALLSYHICKVIPTECIRPKYLYYMLLHELDDTHVDSRRGAYVKYVPLSKIKERMCVIPPLDEQDAISNKLDSLFLNMDKLES
jgi:restriction endonuclease S subunit